MWTRVVCVWSILHPHWRVITFAPTLVCFGFVHVREQWGFGLYQNSAPWLSARLIDTCHFAWCVIGALPHTPCHWGFESLTVVSTIKCWGYLTSLACGGIWVVSTGFTPSITDSLFSPESQKHRTLKTEYQNNFLCSSSVPFYGLTRGVSLDRRWTDFLLARPQKIDWCER